MSWDIDKQELSEAVAVNNAEFLASAYEELQGEARGLRERVSDLEAILLDSIHERTSQIAHDSGYHSSKPSSFYPGPQCNEKGCLACRIHAALNQNKSEGG